MISASSLEERRCWAARPDIIPAGIDAGAAFGPDDAMIGVTAEGPANPADARRGIEPAAAVNSAAAIGPSALPPEVQG